MRQKADKLERGKWYCDSVPDHPTFLRYSHTEKRVDFYTEQKGSGGYWENIDGFITFKHKAHDRFIPTPEDIEKYNLNEE